MQTQVKRSISGVGYSRKSDASPRLNFYMENNPNADRATARKELRAKNYPGGVKLTSKELRDYFATQVSAQVSDPKVVMNLMRHTSLNTTTIHARTVNERMRDAVQNLGKDSGGNSWGQFGGNSSLNPTSRIRGGQSG